jgi:hypothetical protein
LRLQVDSGSKTVKNNPSKKQRSYPHYKGRIFEIKVYRLGSGRGGLFRGRLSRRSGRLRGGGRIGGGSGRSGRLGRRSGLLLLGAALLGLGLRSGLLLLALLRGGARGVIGVGGGLLGLGDLHLLDEHELGDVDRLRVLRAVEELDDLFDALTFAQELLRILADVGVEHVLDVTTIVGDLPKDKVLGRVGLLKAGDLAGHDERNLDIECCCGHVIWLAVSFSARLFLFTGESIC